jgi:multidrug resistance efflux pump
VEKEQPILQLDTKEMNLQLNRLLSVKEALLKDIEMLASPKTRGEKENLKNAVSKAQLQYESSLIQLQALEKEFEQKRMQYYDGAIPEIAFLRAESAWQDVKTQNNINQLVLQNAKNQLHDYPLQMEEKIRAKRDQLNLNSIDIETLQKKLNDCTITSPIAGQIISQELKLNDTVTSKNHIIQIHDNTKYKFVAFVAQEDTKGLKVDQEARIYIKNSDATLTGRVHYIQSALLQDQTTPSANPKLKMEILLNPPLEGVLSGYEGDAEVIVGVTPSIVFIQNNAIRKDNKGIAYVYIVENNKVKKQMIKTGTYNAEVTEVVEGIQPDQMYIVTPPETLKEGDEITS